MVLLTREQVLSIIHDAGALLAPKLNKRPEAASGLVMLAIKTKKGEDGLYSLGSNDLKKILEVSLKDHLDALSISGSKAIIKDLIDELSKKYQFAP